ncbi:MAG: hypothetical protein QXK06_00055 [Candidatus Diapherotrites archaeon]
MSSLKDLYYHLEDRYYEVIDKISAKIPINKITDAIDKVFPSFALLLLIIAALLLYLIFIFLLPVISAKPGVLSLTVKDTQKNPLEGIIVKITYGKETTEFKTDSEGKIPDFNVFIGDTVKKVWIEPDKEDYKFKTPSSGEISEIKIEKERTTLSFVLEEIIKTKEITIKLIDSKTGGLLSDKKAYADISCTDPSLKAPGPVTIERGVLTVTLPINCIPRLDVRMDGYKRWNNTIGPDGIVKLEAEEPIVPPEPKTGDLTVNLYYDKDKSKRVTEEIKVNLYMVEEGAIDSSPIDNKTTLSGQVQFKELQPGQYKVKSIATETLTGEESTTIYVNAGDKKTTSLYLKDRIIGYIKLKIIDETSEAPVKDARLTLKKGLVEVESGLTKETGEYTFSLKEDTKYNLVIDKEGYCLTKLSELTKGNDIKQIKLKKYTGLASQCGGALIVKVQNEAGQGIQGAIVMLFDKEGYYTGTQRTTDINGEAKFTGISNGTYKAFAYRGYSKGWSETTEYNVREGAEKDLLVTMVMQNGTLNVKILDLDKKPLQYSFITLKKAFNDEKIAGPKIVENEDGTISFDVIAGEPVFFVIQKEGYSTLVSQPVTVEPGATKDLNFMLEIMRISGEVKGEFLGLFKNNKRVSIAGAGEEYTAKFRLSMPENAGYEKVGLHVRTGYSSKMELDHIYIKEEKVPGNPNILKGTSFDKTQGINIDSQFLSADGSKWMNFEWSNYTKGHIYLELIIKVRDTAKPDSELPIFWRAWGKKGNQIARDPKDVSLGTTESPQDLYADAYKKTFQVGTETLCTEKWCYSVKILDIEEDLVRSIDNTYSAKVGRPYRLSFSILNNSRSETDTFHNVSAKIWNPEEAIEFGKYNFTGELSIDGNAQGSETPSAMIGTIAPNREVRGTLYFTPKTSISSTLRIRLHDPDRHENIFEKEITIEVLAAEQFKILFEKDGEYGDTPPTLPSGIENEIKVKVQRARDGLEVSGATVKLQNKFGDTLSQTTTTGFGIAIITIPILAPGQKLFVVAEKPDYQALKKEITVDTSVLEVKPDKVSFNLSVIDLLPDTKTIALTNLTQMELTLSDIKFTGDFSGLVDEAKANEWLRTEYLGKKIPSKEKIEIASKAELSDLGKITETSQTLKGKIVFTVSAMGQSWVFQTETTIAIALGGEVDDPNCFTVDKASWQSITQGKETATDIKISNSCTVKGKPVELKNISAKIEWKSNRLGDVWVKIQDIAIALKGNYPKIMRGSLEKESDMTGMISFIPDAGIVGTAEATITFTAEHPTSGGKQILSDSMDISIKIINMAGCLKFDKDLIKIMEGEEGAFTIEATENCGGNVDLQLDTELMTSAKKFSLKVGETKEITVQSLENYPGAYPIYVFAKGPGQSEYSFTKLVRVIIETEGCIRLSQYEFDIQDCENNPYDGFDTAKIINVCHSKTVNAQVKFSEKDWLKAFLNSWPWAIGGFLYGGLNAMSQGKTFWGTDKPETTCSKTGLQYCSGKMMCKNDNIKQVGSVICCASECVTGEQGKTLRDEMCEKKGYIYCATGKCVGEPVPVSGIYCCKGKCQDQFEIEEFTKICKKHGFQYCKEGDECSDKFEWVEGVHCCTGKCSPPEKTPQTMACSAKGLKFCNESNGWVCPSGQEVIDEQKHVKCCATDCIRQEEKTWVCKENETCPRGTKDKCLEPCTPPVQEMTTEDEKCKSESPNYDFCQKGEACLSGTIKVQGIDCCKSMCVDPTNPDYYNQACKAFDSSYRFCDSRTEKCSVTPKTITDPATKKPGLECCPKECTPLEPEEETEEEEEEEEETPPVSEDQSRTCLQAVGIIVVVKPDGSNWKVEEICSNPEEPVFSHYCHLGKCMTGTEICKTTNGYPNFCNIRNGYTCPEGQGVWLKEKEGWQSHLCCKQECVKQTPKCVEGAEKGYECSSDGKTLLVRKTHADCSEYTETFEDCSAKGMQCKGTECVATETSRGATQDYATLDAQCKSFGYGEYCPQGNICEKGGCSSCPNTYPINVSSGLSCCGTGRYCSIRKQQFSPTTTLTQQQICDGAGMGPACTTECSPCTGESCGMPIKPQTATYNGQTASCCPAETVINGKIASYNCVAQTAVQPQLPFMPVALATAGSLLDLGGSLFGTLNTAINSVLGIDNPWMGALVGTIAGTFYNYSQQKEGVLPYMTTARDLNVLSVKLFIPMGLEEKPETQIIVETGTVSKKPNKDFPLGQEETELVFKNNGIKQEEPYKPIFRTFKVEGEKYDYNTEFEVKMEKDAEKLKKGQFLEVKTKEGFTQKFHLQFNAYCAKETPPVVQEEVSCMIGDMTGITGPNAVPKVLFKWDWSSIKENTCDEDGEGMYCDATQFSIELLKKINQVDTLLRGQSFACPEIEGAVSDKSQPLSQNDKDVGLTRIRIAKDGKNAKVIGTIESNNQTEMTVKGVISLTKQGTTSIIACPEAPNGEKAVQVTSREEMDCTFSSLQDGIYTASIQILPQLSTCKAECKNAETANDRIEVLMVIGSGAPAKCEPYSTARLGEYAIANPGNANLKKAADLTNFKANLIMDGYTTDFRNDFDEFAHKNDFFNTPSYYKGDTGLWKYFKNPDLMQFESPFLRPESGYLLSGKYQVSIEIEYKDSSWSLFKGTEPNAKIKVKLNKLVSTAPDSPFYYMPFNGLIGVESNNGRQGYGVNYRQDSLATINVNEDPKQLIRTSTIAMSSTIPGAWVYTAKSNNFRTLNNDKRGVVLDVERSSSESSIVLSPSNATPLILKVSGGKSDRAWAFYSMTIDGEPQITGSSLTTWTGFTRGCRDFTDKEITETYMNRKDLHGGISSEQTCAPVQRKSDYGLEWCDVKRQGNVLLKTVLFTPQGSEAFIELTDSQDDAVFIAPGTAGGKKVHLSGIYAGRIESIEKVFELVKAEDICVAGVGNSAKTVFFWNPKVIIEKSLKQYIDNATNECILPK